MSKNWMIYHILTLLGYHSSLALRLICRYQNIKKDKMRPFQEEGARPASGKRAQKRWDAVENLLLQAIVLFGLPV